MNPTLYVDAGIELAKFIESTIRLYQKGTIDEDQLSQMWHTLGVNVANAESLWQQAGESNDAALAAQPNHA